LTGVQSKVEESGSVPALKIFAPAGVEKSIMLPLESATLSWATAEGDPLAASLELLLVPVALVGVVLEALLGKSESGGSTLPEEA
jgi:hypothetical protein